MSVSITRSLCKSTSSFFREVSLLSTFQLEQIKLIVFQSFRPLRNSDGVMITFDSPVFTVAWRVAMHSKECSVNSK